MKLIKKTINIIDKTNEWVGKIGAYSAVVLMFVIVFEVLSRRFFNKPTIWAFEIITMVCGVLVMITAGYGLFKEVHVRVDIFSTKLSLKQQAILDIICYLVLFFPFVTLLIPASINFAASAWAIKETSWSQWGPIVYPIKTIIPISIILLWLQGFAEVLRHIIFIVEDKTTNKSKVEVK